MIDAASVQQPKSSFRQALKDYGGAVVIAILVALAIRFFLIEAYRIPSSAMKPTLESGDTIFVSKWEFGLRLPWSASRLTQGRPPRYGEVVVFSFPDESQVDYLKRIVGLPADTVQVQKGKLILNGELRDFSNSTNAVCGQEKLPGKDYEICWEPPILEDFGPEKISRDSVFVLGDLRSQSPDARRQRSWGIVPLTAIKGRALWTWLSIEPAGLGRVSWFSRIRFERMFKEIR